jgi:hypothetical protein
MPAAIAIPLALGAGTATAGIVGAKISSNAASDAAAAASVSNDKALAFQKQQAENDYRNQEVARKANFDQWAAGMGAKNSVRAALGLGRITVPAYVPSVDPNFGGAPNTVSGPSVTSSALPANSIRAQQRRQRGPF